MPTAAKEALVAEIKGRMQDASFIVADYRGLSVSKMAELRNELRAAGGEATVYKNSLALIATRELELPDMAELLAGPSAFIFATEDPFAVAKAAAKFQKANEVFEIKGGLIDGVLYDAAGVKAVAALPSREELVAKLMGSMLNPVRGFMAMCNAPAGALARAMQAVADQKAAA
jgi:large subunit ribosomal protein L10